MSWLQPMAPETLTGSCPMAAHQWPCKQSTQVWGKPQHVLLAISPCIGYIRYSNIGFGVTLCQPLFCDRPDCTTRHALFRETYDMFCYTSMPMKKSALEGAIQSAVPAVWNFTFFHQLKGLNWHRSMPATWHCDSQTAG